MTVNYHLQHIYYVVGGHLKGFPALLTALLHISMSPASRPAKCHLYRRSSLMQTSSPDQTYLLVLSACLIIPSVIFVKTTLSFSQMSSEANQELGFTSLVEQIKPNLFIEFQNQQSNSPELQTSEIPFMEIMGMQAAIQCRSPYIHSYFSVNHIRLH